MSEIDILYIDNKILQNFKDEKEKLPEYKNKLENIQNCLKIDNLRSNLTETLIKSEKELSEYIIDLETDHSKNFYIIETADLIEKYKEILNKPVKMSFTGKSNKTNKEKNAIINSYIEISNKYVDIKINIEKKDKNVCKNCNNKDFDIEDGNIYICSNCSAQQFILKNVSSYKDIDRINISSKYLYDRRIHFRDCINQYQGKQNSTVHQKVYDDLEKEFELHHLISSDKSIPKNERFKNITKEHINIFLKDLGYSKHYENTNLIHYNLTVIKPDDISHLEDKLLEDFDILTDMYDKLYKNIDRKNFINTQFLLFSLLVKHKHPCKKEDFSILKTVDRLNFHNDIANQLFQAIGWTYNCMF